MKQKIVNISQFENTEIILNFSKIECFTSCILTSSFFFKIGDEDLRLELDTFLKQ